MLQKSNQKAILVQCICYQMVFYLVSEFSEGIIKMAEILTIDVPKEIDKIDSFLQKVDDTKRLSPLYDHQMETSYKNSRSLDDEKTQL